MKKKFMTIANISMLIISSFSSSVYGVQVTLTWDKPDDNRVTGYNIYCGISGTDFTSTPVRKITSADQTTCTFNGLIEGENYEFSATSTDANRNESGFSEIIYYNIPVLVSDVNGDGYSVTEGDCNDTDAFIYPGAIEICGDGIDQDCDGSDLACTTDTENIDDDADGFTESQGDCNDNDAAIHPDADDICDDGIDQDCNGSDAECSVKNKSSDSGCFIQTLGTRFYF